MYELVGRITIYSLLTFSILFFLIYLGNNENPKIHTVPRLIIKSFIYPILIIWTCVFFTITKILNFYFGKILNKNVLNYVKKRIAYRPLRSENYKEELEKIRQLELQYGLYKNFWNSIKTGFSLRLYKFTQNSRYLEEKSIFTSLKKLTLQWWKV